nr:hypothetical protein [Vibrio parahaemolyticus]
MWISGLKANSTKPFVHLPPHPPDTQFSEALPWESIDMNYIFGGGGGKT